MGLKEAVGSDTEFSGYFEMHECITRLAAILWPGVASLHNSALLFSKEFCEYCRVKSGYLWLFSYITQSYKHRTRLYLTEGDFPFENKEKTSSRIFETY